MDHFQSSPIERSASQRRIAAVVVTALSVLCGGVSLFAQPVDITTKQVGRLTSVGTAGTRTYYQYDLRGRTTATQLVQDGQSRVVATAYGYPHNTAATTGPGTVVLKETLADGEQVTYTYDASGARVMVRATLGTTTDDILRDYRTNARGQVTRLVLGNGTTTDVTYNETGDLEMAGTVTTNAAGQKIQEYRYTYDLNGNVTGTSDGVRPDQSATYEYDELGQLTAIFDSSGGTIERYDYDAIGNLVQKGARTQTYGAGGRPHALATSGGMSYGYDANGNVLSIGGTTTFEWNSENMPIRAASGAVVTQRSYVGETLWKKVEQGTTTYYLPSMRVENGVIRKYYGALAERLEQPGDRQLRFYHPDHLGSSSVMTDQSGNVIRRASYLPWGEDRGVDATFTPKLQFNFKEKDAIGLYDYGARLYNPATGRWLSPDTSLADGMNRYAYVRNNPWTKIDPTGHQSQTPQQPPPPPLQMPRFDAVDFWSFEARVHQNDWWAWLDPYYELRPVNSHKSYGSREATAEFNAWINMFSQDLLQFAVAFENFEKYPETMTTVTVTDTYQAGVSLAAAPTGPTVTGTAGYQLAYANAVTLRSPAEVCSNANSLRRAVEMNSAQRLASMPHVHGERPQLSTLGQLTVTSPDLYPKSVPMSTQLSNDIITIGINRVESVWKERWNSGTVDNFIRACKLRQ